MASPGSFPSCPEENDPDPKSSWDLHQNKPVYFISCQKDVTKPVFLLAFCCFCPNSTTFATNPRVVESVTGSIPAEHAHKDDITANN